MNALTGKFEAPPDLRNGDGRNCVPMFLAAGLAAFFNDKQDVGLVGVALMTRKAARLFSRAAAEELITVDTRDYYRVVALIIGATRGSIEMHYRTTDGDIEPAQLDATMTPNDNSAYGATDDLGDAAFRSCVAAMAAELVADGTARTAYAPTDAGFFGGPLTAEETMLMAKCAKAAPGLLATTGVTLVASGGHHFVEPHKQITLALVNQVFTKRWKHGSYAGLTAAEFEDTFCHKATHCYKSTFMMEMAVSTQLMERLNRMDLGSAAVRMPAKNAMLVRASAFLKVLLSCRGTVEAANVTFGDRYHDLVEKLSGVGARFEELAADAFAARFELSRTVMDEIAADLDLVAFMAGAYDAITDGGEAGSRGILGAYSVMRVMEEYPSEVNAGREQIRASNKWKKGLAKEGVLVGIGLGGAAAPKHLARAEDVADHAAAAQGGNSGAGGV